MANTKLPPLNKTIAATPELNAHLRGSFHRVMLNMLPIKADMACLRDFCDSYLNFVDDANRPPFYFKPAMPFVFLQVLHYPYMANRTQNAFAIAQNEVAFSMWLECYAIEHGQRVFKTLALCSPYIYLDNQLSLLTGRDVFGYPKAQLTFLPLRPSLNPAAPSLLARLAIRVRSGSGDINRPFLEVYQQPRMYSSMRRAVPEMLAAIPRAVTGWISLADRMWDALAHFPLSGYERTRDVDSLVGGAATLADWMAATVPHLTAQRPGPMRYGSTADVQLEPLSTDIITLKQFRDAEDPETACYQAIIRSSMYTTHFIDAGPLFDPLSLDPGTGIRVKLHQTEDQPIVESFGLEVIDETLTEQGLIATLSPIAPFWLELDLMYGLGFPMYWRTKGSSWSSTEEVVQGYSAPQPKQEIGFVTFGSGAVNSLASRFVSPDNVIRVLPLPMSEEGVTHLNKLCANLLDDRNYSLRLHLPPGENNKPGFVFMIVRSMQNRLATTGNPLGVYSDLEVEFAILVELSIKGQNGQNSDKTIIALLPLYLFTDSETTEITEREVYGLPTVLATIDASGNSWPYGAFASAEKPLTVLRVTTAVIPALHAGLRPENRVLVEVTGELNEEIATKLSETNRRIAIESDLKAKILNHPVPNIALKQFPDSRDPELACYQAIVSRVFRIDSFKDCQYDILDLTVRIHHYPSFELSQVLGLKIEETLGGEDTVIEVVKPAQPFWIQGGMHADKAQTICFRAGGSEWRPTGYFGDTTVDQSQLVAGIDKLVNDLRLAQIEAEKRRAHIEQSFPETGGAERDPEDPTPLH
jgi:hypothetical protein